MELKFEVNNQELVLITDTSKIANKSNNYLQLFFDFLTDDWLDKTKYCILKSSDQENFLFNVYDDVPVKVPSQVLIGRFFYITLYGVGNDDERITTNVLKVRILESDFSLKFSSVQGDYDAFNDLRNQIRLLDESISLVGKTGEYSDLLNIPSNFTPAEHTHTASDITNFEEKTASEIKYALRQTANKIRNYGG